jgi:hypothetical protein
VTDPSLNKPADVAPQPASEPPRNASVNGPAAPSLSDQLIAQMVTLNATLLQVLAAEQGQTAGIDNLARALGRPQFSDNQDLLRYLQRTS